MAGMGKELETRAAIYASRWMFPSTGERGRNDLNCYEDFRTEKGSSQGQNEWLIVPKLALQRFL